MEVGIVAEKRSVWMRDLALLWLGTGTSLSGTVLFLWSVMSGSFGDPASVPYWLALFTFAACSAIGILAVLSRQRGEIGEIELALPWYPFVLLRRAKRIPYASLREVTLESRGSLRPAVLTLADGRRLRLELLDFENPDGAAQILRAVRSRHGT